MPVEIIGHILFFSQVSLYEKIPDRDFHQHHISQYIARNIATTLSCTVVFEHYRIFSISILYL
jgi:hypothetical protein